MSKKKFLGKALSFIIVLTIVLSISIALCACDSHDEPQQEKKAIIIVPGILASALYNEETDKAIWDPFPLAEDIDIMSFMGGTETGIGDGVAALLSKYKISDIIGLVNEIMDGTDK